MNDEQSAIKQYYTKLAFGQDTTENEKTLLEERLAKMNNNSKPVSMIEPAPMSEPESPYIPQSYSYHRGNVHLR